MVVALLGHDAGLVDLVEPAAELVQRAPRARRAPERLGALLAERHAERRAIVGLRSIGRERRIEHDRERLLLERGEAVEHVGGDARVDHEHRRHGGGGLLLLAAQRRLVLLDAEVVGRDDALARDVAFPRAVTVLGGLARGSQATSTSSPTTTAARTA